MSPKRHVELDGVVSDRGNCLDLLRDPKLEEIGMSGGELKLTLNEGKNGILAVTEYFSPRKLDQSELAALTKHTQSQWSDGFGSDAFVGIEEKLGLDITIFPDYTNDALAVEQTSLSYDVPRKRTNAGIFKAIGEQDVSKLRGAIKAGEPVNESRDDSTPLVDAINSEFVEGVEVLVLAGAQVNQRSEFRKFRPIHYVASGRMSDDHSVRIARLLIQHGATIDMEGDADKPLALAKEREKPKLVEFLKKSGGRA